MHAAPAAQVDPALVGRKRPRSPATRAITATSTAAGVGMDQQRLLSFAHFTAAVRDAHRPIASAPLVLPGISHLLNQAPQPQPLAPASRQRVSVSGDYIERQQGSPAPASRPASPAAAAASTAHVASSALSPARSAHDGNDDDDDDEAEDKTPWPSASQYHDIFASMHLARIPVYDLGVDPRGVPLHPEFIYSEPVSCMYFLKCAQLLGKGSFGFPRKKKAASVVETTAAGVTAVGKKNGAGKGKKESSKDFEWRKMSFVTGLPKKQPVVRYITATCYSRASDVAAKKKVFRMHAVMLADASGASEAGEYVLVHIRAGGSKRVGLRASAALEAEPPRTVAPLSPVPSHHRDGCDNSSSSNSNAVAAGDSARRPVSPPMTTTASYSSHAASTSPRHKKLLHADFSASHFALSSNGSDFAQSPEQPQTRSSLQSSPQQLQTQPQPQPQSLPMARHPLMASALPSLDMAKFSSARQAVRDLILHSCSSRDEVATYVRCLQQELAALQQQSEQ